MGQTDSTAKLGERVLTAKRKLVQDRTIQSERYEYLKTYCPDILDEIMESIAASFKSCSPFLEPTLLVAWINDPETCKAIVLDSCRKVLTAPITKREYSWFKEYVFPSSLWMFRTPHGNKYMYQELLNIDKDMSHDIIDSMDSIYCHLQIHSKWKQVMDINNVSYVLRQDHESVGLLQTKGFKDLFESKRDDEKSEDMKSYIDSNLAINILTSTATNINHEFQNHIKTIMSHYGSFKPGPTKKVQRCVSKLENDYHKSAWPKSAKLLDLVRCSVAFNTVDQLIVGFNNLIKHIDKNQSIIELARIKNGFTDKTQNGYRDIKVNVIYKSQITFGLNMICEIQLLLVQYLEEKKRIHKLYSILREELYFQMVVQEEKKELQTTESLKDLNIIPLLNVSEQVSMHLSYTENGIDGWLFGKCSVDSEFGLLGMEGQDWFGVFDMETKQSIFETKRDSPRHPWYARQSHSFITINKEKYVSVQMSKIQIKMFQITAENKLINFIENEKYTINLPTDNIINYCAFDSNFESILLIINYTTVQKRSMGNINNITASITLQENITQSSFRQLNLSSDGSLCALGGGGSTNYFYLIDINNNKQYKLTSNVLSDTYAPCFINGDNKFISIGDKKGRIEIWDLINKKAIRTIKIGVSKWITAMASANNILAIGGYEKQLRLYDVTNWECFYIEKYDTDAGSLHLTNDLKYLTLSGIGGDGCFVLKIE